MITKEMFDHYVPAFLSPTEEVLDKMAASIAGTEAAAREQLGDITPYATSTITDRLNAFICRRAAYEAIPQLDLVLTATGFGVVSNQNLTPASRERVESLREQLRKDSSTDFDLLVMNLLATEWKATTEAETFVQSLLWCPLLLRNNGVTWQNRQVYHEEMRQLMPTLRAAESKLRHVMSDELHGKILELLRLGTLSAGGVSAGYSLACKRGREYLAAYLKDRSAAGETYAGTILYDLERILDKYAAAMVEYAESQEYKAKKTPRYANKKDDATYFFG